MNIAEEKISELKWAAESLIRTGEQILGIVEAAKVRKEAKSESSGGEKVKTMTAILKAKK